MEILAAHLSGYFTVVGAGRVEQQQGMTGWRRIHHHEFPAGLADHP